MNGLLIFLVAQGGIERVELPFGGFHRPGEWSVAVVHLRSEVPWKDAVVEVETASGPRFSSRIDLPAGGRAALRIPFCAPGGARPAVVLRVGERAVSRVEFPDSWRAISEADLLVGVDLRAEGAPAFLPAVLSLGPERRAFLFELPAEVPEGSWMFEAVDVVVGGSLPGGGGFWKATGGEAWADATGLEERLRAFESRRGSRFPRVDEAAWRLKGGAKRAERRDRVLVLFVIVHAFVVSMTLFWIGGRKGGAGTSIVVLAVCAASAAAGALGVPKGRLVLESHRFDFRNPDGSGARMHVVFADAASSGPVEIRFARPLVKPLARDPGEAGARGTDLEFGGGTCLVRISNGRAAFLEAIDAPPPRVELRVADGPPPYRTELYSEERLERADLLVRRWNHPVGEWTADLRGSVEIAEDGPPPSGRDFEFLRPRLPGTGRDSFLFARLVPPPAYSEAASPDLLQSVTAGRTLVARFAGE